jgi:hypothetical protein
MHTTAPHSNAIQSALSAEEERRQALLTGNWLMLDRLLSDDLIYVHSTTVRDNKVSLMAKLASGELQYLQVNFEDLDAHVAGNCVVITGRLSAEISKQGQSKHVRSLFMTVWKLVDTGSTEQKWQLTAHQGTALPV